MAEMRAGVMFRRRAAPALFAAQIFGPAAIALMLYWLLHFRDGFSFTSHNKQRLFNLHPFLMLLGPIICNGEAIMVFKMLPGRRNIKKSVHMALHLLGILLAGLGFYAVFKFDKDLHISNLYTLHSWIGIATISLFALQWFIALVAFWFGGSTRPFRARLGPMHSFFGLILFIMAMVSAELGLLEKFFFLGLHHEREAYFVNSIGLAILLFGFSVLRVVVHTR